MAPPQCEMIAYLQQLPPLPPSAPGLAATVLNLLETELRFPTGALLPPAPPLRFSLLVFSPDCGYVLESAGPPLLSPAQHSHLTGPKTEVHYITARHHLLLFTLVLIGQLVLLKRQMRESSTPSTRSRISLYTISILALGDGFVFMVFLLLSFFVPALWVSLMSAAFVAFVCVSFFGMKFLMDLWLAQAPEREERRRAEAAEEAERVRRYQETLDRLVRERRERVRVAGEDGGEVGPTEEERFIAQEETGATGNGIATNPPAASEAVPQEQQTLPRTLPLPAPAIRPPTDTGATPFFLPSDQETPPSPTLPTTNPTTTTPPTILTRESFGAVYTRFYLLLLLTLFLSLNATSWPPGLRRAYFTFLGLCYLSFLTPQILRNAHRNSRRALSWEFVIGQSFLRLYPFAYFYFYRGNVVFASRDLVSLTLLAGWVWLQVLALASQEFLGPRWFVRGDWVEKAYDYHPVLREDVEAGGGVMPIGFQTHETAAPDSPVAGRAGSLALERRNSEAKERGSGKRVFDCAICMQELEVPVVEAGADGGGDGGAAPGLLARRLYMVTPCRHLFHSGCLEGWMKYRLQCPVCREGLPPL